MSEKSALLGMSCGPLGDIFCDFHVSGREDAKIARNVIRIAYAGVRTGRPEGQNGTEIDSK